MTASERFVWTIDLLGGGRFKLRNAYDRVLLADATEEEVAAEVSRNDPRPILKMIWEGELDTDEERRLHLAFGDRGIYLGGEP